MGRAILIVVLLVSTIYAGIIIQVQKEMYKLPEVIVDNLLSKELENVSDYALRAAVRLGTEDIVMETGVFTKVVSFAGNEVRNYDINGVLLDTMNVVFDEYRQGNCTIDSILYRRMSYNYMEATTYSSGTLQGRTMDYVAQIAYDYIHSTVDGPLVLYNEYNQQTHTPDELPDQSEHPSGVPMEGYCVAVGTDFSNIIHYSPLGLDKYFEGGGGTHKCLEFGAAQTNGKNHTGAWVQTPNPMADSTTYQILLDRLKTYNEFTVALYAIPTLIKNPDASVTNQGTGGITNGGNVGTLFWAASNPNNSKTGEPGYSRPSAAIWYDDRQGGANNSTATMHFGVTVNDGTADGTYMEITMPGARIYNNVKREYWRMYTMTFYYGVLTAYYDADPIGTLTAPGGHTQIMPNDYGFTLGMRDIRADSPTGLCPTQYKHPGTNYMFYNGLLDQITFWDKALTPEEVENWFNNYVDASVKYYIKD